MIKNKIINGRLMSQSKKCAGLHGIRDLEGSLTILRSGVINSTITKVIKKDWKSLVWDQENSCQDFYKSDST